MRKNPRETWVNLINAVEEAGVALKSDGATETIQVHTADGETHELTHAKVACALLLQSAQHLQIMGSKATCMDSPDGAVAAAAIMRAVLNLNTVALMLQGEPSGEVREDALVYGAYVDEGFGKATSWKWRNADHLTALIESMKENHPDNQGG